MDWKIAFPLHPEYRTLPMVWYVPPLSPIQAAAANGDLGEVGGMPDVKSLAHSAAVPRQPADRRPHRAGRGWRWSGCWPCAPTCARKTVDGVIRDDVAERVGLSGADIEEMYQLMAIANYEDRFVIPTAHRETGEDAYRAAAAPAASPSARAAPGKHRLQPVRRQEGREDTDGGGVMARTWRALARPAATRPKSCRRRRAKSPTMLAAEGLLPAPRAGRAPPAAGSSWPRDDIYEAQERYHLLFDRSRTLSLHLFEHVHGESRDRGQAMVDLLGLYEEHGLDTARRTSCPTSCRCSSNSSRCCPTPRRARCSPNRPASWPTRRPARTRATPPYAAVFAALAELAAGARRGDAGQRAEDPDDLAALDAAWEEAAVRFGPGEAVDGCSTARLRTSGLRAPPDASAACRRAADERLAEHRPLRLVSLCRAHRVPARQPAALRHLAIHLAERLQPVAAAAPADAGARTCSTSAFWSSSAAMSSAC